MRLSLDMLQSVFLLRNVRLLFHLPLFTEKVRACPICGGKGQFEFKNAYTPLQRCVECDHVYAVKLPGRRILNLLYGDFSYWAKDKGHQGITEIAYGDHWAGFLKARMDIMLNTGVLSHDRPRKVFEIGCSEGILLEELRHCGHEAAGCEMNRAIAEQGIAEFGVNVAIATIEEMEIREGYHDLVVAFHTIEHLRRPVQVLEKVARMLRTEGAILIEVPCGKEEYVNRDHLQFFGEESLRRLIGKFFERVEIVPNSYNACCGEPVGSLYGIGKGVKASLAPGSAQTGRSP